VLRPEHLHGGEVDYGWRGGAREEGDLVGVGIQRAVRSRGSGGRTHTTAARADTGQLRAQARERSDQGQGSSGCRPRRGACRGRAAAETATARAQWCRAASAERIGTDWDG
jgi:hypothetical protein